MPRGNRRKIDLKQLGELWGKYAEFRRSQISPATYSRDYQKISRRIAAIQAAASFLDTSIELRDWMLENYSAETTRRTLVQINAAYRWAMESDLITVNPFEGVQRHIRPAAPTDRAWAAFTPDERDRIISEFERNYSFYAPWVKFLFWTGCRPEEAAALRWRHISQDCLEILFCEALPVDVHESQGTKNGKVTRFPCNHRLQTLLWSIRPAIPDTDSLVFEARTGGRFNYSNFQTRYWKPVLGHLVDRGQVSFYLTQYHCRHTWITLALEHLSVSDVAYLARVSPAIIYRHYAGRSRRLVIPEF